VGGEAAGWELVRADRVRLEHPDGPAPHAVAAPAEDDGVKASRQDPGDQNLSLVTVEDPANEEAHRDG